MPKAKSSSSTTTNKCVLSDSDVDKLITTKLVRFKENNSSEFLTKYLKPKSDGSPNTNMKQLKVDELKDILRFLTQEKGKHLTLSGKKDELIRRCSSALFPSAEDIASASSSQSSYNPSMAMRFAHALPSALHSSNLLSGNSSSMSGASLNLQRNKSLMETTLQAKIETILQTSKTINGLIDPRYPIEQIIELKHCHIPSGHSGGYHKVGFAFELTKQNMEKLSMQSNLYEVDVHLFEITQTDRVIDSLDLKAQNWGDGTLFRVNDGPTLSKPKTIKALQKNKKGKTKANVVCSTPARLQLLSKKPIVSRSSTLSFDICYGLNESSNWNRLEVQSPPNTSFNSIILITLSLKRTVDELIASVKQSYEESKQHNLRLDDDDSTMTDALGSGGSGSSDVSTTSIPPVIFPPQQQDEDEDLFSCDEEVITIKDPIVMCQIEVPAKGKFCVHKRCFDLDTYVRYCADFRIWQCPCCHRRCPHEELVVDDYLTQVLSKIPKDQSVDKIKINNKTGEWEIVDTSAKSRSDAPATPHNKKEISTAAPTPSSKVEAEVISIDNDDGEMQDDDRDGQIESSPLSPALALSRALSSDLSSQRSTPYAFKAINSKLMNTTYSPSFLGLLSKKVTTKATLEKNHSNGLTIDEAIEID